MQLVARIKQRIREIKGDFQFPAGPDAGARNSAHLPQIAAGGPVPAGEVLVIFRFASGHPEGALVGAALVGDIDHQIGAGAAVVFHLGGKGNGLGRHSRRRGNCGGESQGGHHHHLLLHFQNSMFCFPAFS